MNTVVRLSKRREHNQNRKGYARLGELRIGQRFELPSESGYWSKIGHQNDKGLIPIAVAGTYVTSKFLSPETTVVLDL